MTFAISKEIYFLVGHNLHLKLTRMCRAPMGVPHVNENRYMRNVVYFITEIKCLLGFSVKSISFGR
jgi:hypothetical protein